MADIAPLAPLRYDASRLTGGLASVVAPPYDVISTEDRAVLAARDPHNIVRLILPDGEGDAKYGVAGRLFAEWQNAGILIRDSVAAFYRYDQSFVPPGSAPGAMSLSRRGFLALVRLVPFSDRVVLPHERTLSGPKEDRLKLFHATRANLSPGFMLYRDARGDLNGPLDRAEPIADFTTSDGIGHKLAKVTDPDAIRAIVDGISRSTLLIADGHHRYETALRYSREAAAGPAQARGEHLYFMTFLANGDDPNLVVFPTHRHVHSLPHFSFDELLNGARPHFTVRELEPGSPANDILDALRRVAAGGPSVAAAGSDGRVALLTLRSGSGLPAHPILADKPLVLRDADITVLHAGILEHILKITPEAQAAKTNLWYPQDATAALGSVRHGRGQALFLMNPTPVEQVRRVAEAGEVMPQKSTFFYPKVMTGLAVHTLDPARDVPDV